MHRYAGRREQTWGPLGALQHKQLVSDLESTLATRLVTHLWNMCVLSSLSRPRQEQRSTRPQRVDWVRDLALQIPPGHQAFEVFTGNANDVSAVASYGGS